MKKELGKINSVKIGLGGYNDAMFGVTIGLEGKGWGVGDFISGGWDINIIDRYPDCKWTESDRDKMQSDMIKKISNLLAQARVKNLEELKGKPVEVFFDENNTLKEWKILTEVL